MDFEMKDIKLGSIIEVFKDIYYIDITRSKPKGFVEGVIITSEDINNYIILEEGEHEVKQLGNKMIIGNHKIYMKLVRTFLEMDLIEIKE